MSSFDHNIGPVMVDGPGGSRITVREACELVGEGPEGNRMYYNDIQCGNGPANDAGDEDPGNCPGRVDLGDYVRTGCNDKGPKWQFPNDGPPPSAPPPAPVPDPEEGMFSFVMNVARDQFVSASDRKPAS